MRSRPVLAVLLALLAGQAALAGCAGLEDVPGDPFRGEPDAATVGWQDGYWYDDPVAVTTGDGLNASERDALVARTMARVERIRGEPFRENVTVEVVGREEYRNRSVAFGVSDDPWNEQVWEALLLVGEDESVGEAFESTLGASVQGYYEPGNGSIVLVSDSGTPTVDRTTLAHELVHALQDQHGALDATGETQDDQLARQSVTEGEANYVMSLYEARCGQRWDCVDRPAAEQSSGGSADDGVFLVVYQPYATGPAFVHDVRDAGGWDAVDDLYDDPPDSTEQVIHPDAHPEEEPANVSVPDRSNGEWSRFDHDPVADTAGEASIYAMLAANDAVDVDRQDLYEYESDPSAGWAGDTLVPYHDGDEGYGYVWRIEWDTERDAAEFDDAYRGIIADWATERPTDDVYVVPESHRFGDAFRVTRDGTTVTVVNAPTRGDLDAIHAPRDG